MKLERYKELESKYSDQTVMVIGDLMLDNYLWGEATRISPEAPVPVIKVESTSSNPGGAANVVYNLTSLGCHVITCGVVGDDPNGSILKSILGEYGSDISEILVDPHRPTTVKTRIIAHNQQVVRTDWEDTSSVTDDILTQLIDRIDSRLEECDAVILEDYNKGLINRVLIDHVVLQCRNRVIPVYADPKVDHFFDYQGVTLFKPNLKETSEAFGYEIDSDEALLKVEEEIIKRLACKMVLITRGDKGMDIFDGEGRHNIPTKARSVHDVSGAGDTVISVFCLTHLSGATPVEAATVANYAAGRVCEEVGVVPITRENLHEIITHHNS